MEGEKDSNQQQKDDVIAEEVSENANDDKGGPNEWIEWFLGEKEIYVHQMHSILYNCSKIKSEFA